MVDINKSKATISLILVVAIIVLAVTVYIPSTLDENDPTDPIPNNTNNTDNVDNDNEVIYNSDINIEGISVINNGTDVRMNSTTIISNHQDILRDNSWRIAYSSPDLQAEYEKFGPRVLETVENQYARDERYGDGEIIYERSSLGSDPIYNAREGIIESARYTRVQDIQTYIQSLDVQNVSDTSNGIEIELSSRNNLGQLATQLGVDSLDRASTTMNIRDDGLITSYNTTLIVESLGVPDTSRYEYNVDRVGDVTVNRPNWITNVENSVMLGNITTDNQNNWIEVEHRGLATIPSGSNVTIETTSDDTESGNVDQIQIQEEFSEGDTMYISPESVGEWNVYINQEPESEGQLEISDGQAFIIISDEDTTYFSGVLRA